MVVLARGPVVILVVPAVDFLVVVMLVLPGVVVSKSCNCML